ncbi:hypothetical protein B0T24DRAFT_672698 [Lasiosphaeria ovina]|uniref:Uncharacterized protein n=1 Tax=Lasiosphaeria ovina TaxID=92902 RepID=A0AAE0NJN5_9PEZI|nr:hypothetical protein B0T24DRAFT_672698 [Lasiosphaeria ovina]
MSGVTGAGKMVTSTVGNTVGGLTNTVGGVVGAASRGIGETVTGATGGLGKPLGDGIANIGTGLEGGVASVSQGVKDAGEWKSNPSHNQTFDELQLDHAEPRITNGAGLTSWETCESSRATCTAD